MSAIREAAMELEAALRVVPGAYVYTDPGAALTDLPALVLGPPALSFTNGRPRPTEARFTVHVVVQADEHAAATIWDLIGEVSAAVDERTAAVVAPGMSATPTKFKDLPAYDVQVDFPLEQR